MEKNQKKITDRAPGKSAEKSNENAKAKGLGDKNTLPALKKKSNRGKSHSNKGKKRVGNADIAAEIAAGIAEAELIKEEKKAREAKKESAKKEAPAKKSAPNSKAAAMKQGASQKKDKNETKAVSEVFTVKKNENSRVRIIPLGGLNEIGKNMTAIECDDDIIVIDCGLAFPDEEMPGVDLVIPDVTYLEANASKLRGIVLTHGHEDHIGAIPYVLRNINTPIYGTRLTVGIVRNKLKEFTLDVVPKLIEVKAGDIIRGV